MAKLTPSDATGVGSFGRSVAIRGDTVIVGAIGDNEQGQFTGAAYIFERHHSGANAWGEVTKLRTSGAARGDVFGESVSISGDMVVVGAPQNREPYPDRAGFATVFERNHLGVGAWGEVARLTASDGEPGVLFFRPGDGFGFSVSISGDTVVVGAPWNEDRARGFGVGSAYVFTRSGSDPGVWTESAKLTVSDVVYATWFGWSVSVSGDTALVGAPGTVAAYVFTMEAGNPHAWTEVAKLRGRDIRVPDQVQSDFGTSVSISGSIAIVGAKNDDEKGGLRSRSGSAYVFQRDAGAAGTWNELHKLTAHDGASADAFGTGVFVSGTTAVVGAPTLGGGPGSAYVCPLDTLSSVIGACRRAIPVVNDLVTMSDMTTSCCDDDTYVITATFTNSSTVPIQGPFFEVISLATGNVLLENADGGPGGVGATLTPDVGDGILSPGEPMTVTFVIRLLTRQTFWFHVDLRGEPGP